MSLTFLNYRGLKTGAIVQNVFTFLKIAALSLIIIVGFYFGVKGGGNWGNFSPAFPDLINIVTIGMFGAAMVGALFPPMPGTISALPPAK